MPFHLSRVLTFLLVIAMWNFSFADEQTNDQALNSAAQTASSVSLQEPVVQALSVVESAVYSAQIAGAELSQGTMTLDVVRYGAGPSLLDWSETNLALESLRWDDQPLISGTDSQQRFQIFTDRDSDRFHANWSLRGERIGDLIVFDLRFPSALNTQCEFNIPEGFVLHSSHGLLNQQTNDENAQTIWNLDLGRDRSTTLTLTPADLKSGKASTNYEVDTLNVARRDGIFTQSELIVSDIPPDTEQLRLKVPHDLDLQSLTISDIPLKFERSQETPDEVLVSLKTVTLPSPFRLRVRAFQPVLWGEKRVLPRVQLLDAMENRRTLRIRVEPPLQMQMAESYGMIQTGLSSDETAGELWRYEARSSDGSVVVDINFSQTEVVSETVCLRENRGKSPWVAAEIAVRTENGSRFHSDIQLPSDWILISVTEGDADSRISHWERNQRRLSVTWQNPITPNTTRLLRLFALCPPLQLDKADRLAIPTVADAVEARYQHYLLIGRNENAEILEGEGWRQLEATEIPPSFQQFPEIITRLSSIDQPLSLVHLQSSGHGSDSPTVQIASSHHRTRQTENEEVTNANRSEAAVEEADQVTADMSLTTTVGQSEQHDRVHHVTFHFDRAVAPSTFHLKLDPSCVLSTVMGDHQFITVIRDRDSIRFPAEVPALTHLRLTYVTRGEASQFQVIDRIPLPRIDIPVLSFDWTLDLPGHMRLTSMELPEIFPNAASQQPTRVTLLGPLSRSANEKIFNPFSPSDWKNFWTPQAALQNQTSRQIFTLHSPAIGDVARFETYDATLSRNAGWIALFGSLLAGIAVRMFSLTRLKNFAIVWLAMLCLAVVLAPPAFQSILGGMIAGSLLAILMPDRFALTRDFLNRSASDVTVIQKTSTTALMLIAGGALLFTTPGQSCSAAEPEKPVLKSSLPNYLLQSAHYEMISTAPIPRIQAQFEVLVRNVPETVLVRFPFQNVIFANEAECRVNGEPQPLIPSFSGDAVVVRINPVSNESEQSEEDVSPSLPEAAYTSHQVEMTFSVRTQFSTNDSGVGSIDAVIPTVAESTFTVPADFNAERIVRQGEIRRDSSQKQIIQLGNLGRLRTAHPGGFGILPAQTTAVTLLDISPLRIKGQTRISSGTTPLPEKFALTFPAGASVQTVTGTGVVDWFKTDSTDSEIEITIRMRKDASSTSLNVSYELPQIPSQNSLITIPAFPLWKGNSMLHTLGITVPPATTVSLVSNGPVPLSPEEWGLLGESARLRPALAFLLNAPQPVSIQYSQVTPERTATIAEDLLVEKESLIWTATLRTNVSRVPVFFHRLQVDRHVRIDSVLAGEEGSEGPVRFSQANDGSLKIFISGGQLGERAFTLHGTVAITPDVWTAIPGLELLDTTILGTELAIRDSTFWNIDLETAAGDKIPTVPLEAVADLPSGERFRPVAFRKDSAVRPVRLRTQLPPHAVKADSITLLRMPPQGDWELMSAFQLNAQDVALNRAIFTIPGVWENVRVRPTHLRHTITKTAEGTMVTVRIPAHRTSTIVPIVVSAKLSSEAVQTLADQKTSHNRMTLPLIEVSSAQRGTQLLLVHSESNFAPALVGTLPSSADQVPSWTPQPWQQMIRDKQLVSYQQTHTNLELITRSSNMGGEPYVPLEETIIWSLKDGTSAGKTRLWIDVHQITRLSLHVAAPARIDRVIDNNHRLLPIDHHSEIEVNQNTNQKLLYLDIHWSSNQEGHLVQPLVFENLTPQRRLLAIQRPRGWNFISRSGTPANLLDVSLLRWEGLMDFVNELNAPLPMQGVMMQNIRTIQKQTMSLYEDEEAALSTTQKNHYQNLLSRWEELQNSLLVTDNSTAPTANSSTSQNLMSDLIHSPDTSIQIDWWIPEEASWSGQLTPPSFWSKAGASSRDVLLILLATALILRLTVWRMRIRSWWSRHAVWSLAIFGLIWWLFFSPSLMGFLLILIAVASGLRDYWQNLNTKLSAT